MNDTLSGSSLSWQMILDERFCRDRAAETRRLAENTSAEESKVLMEIAERYERLAALANPASERQITVLPGGR
jgi:hypothetical protein